MWYVLPRPQHECKVRVLVSTKAEAIAVFERKCKRAGIEPPHDYPPDVSGDSFTGNHIDYPHWAAWVPDGHGWVYVDARNDFGQDRP